MFMPDVLTSSAGGAPRTGRPDRERFRPLSCSRTTTASALRYSNWRRHIWEPTTAAAGCAGAGFHDLRRLNATTLVVEGVDVKTAQTRLGHADPRVTLAIYASAPASVDRAAVDAIGERHFGADRHGSGSAAGRSRKAPQAPEIVPRHLPRHWFELLSIRPAAGP